VQREGSAVDEVPVEDGELHRRHGVQQLNDRPRRVEVARGVEHQPSVAEARSVVDRPRRVVDHHARSVVVVAAELREGLQAVQRALQRRRGERRGAPARADVERVALVTVQLRRRRRAGGLGLYAG